MYGDQTENVCKILMCRTGHLHGIAQMLFCPKWIGLVQRAREHGSGSIPNFKLCTYPRTPPPPPPIYIYIRQNSVLEGNGGISIEMLRLHAVWLT